MLEPQLGAPDAICERLGRGNYVEAGEDVEACEQGKVLESALTWPITTDSIIDLRGINVA